jgi:hypothetical protein
MNTLRDYLRYCFALAAIAIITQSSAAWAFERSDGVKVACMIERNGQTKPANEIWLGHGDSGDRHPELGGAAAVVRNDAEGWPVIYFDNVVFKGMLERDPHMADFIFYHECGHAKNNQLDEIEANCYAYIELEKLGLLNASKAAALAATHKKMLRLPSRYGGNGETFWARTLECVQQQTQNSSAAK